jgi:hypothetical protein
MLSINTNLGRKIKINISHNIKFYCYGKYLIGNLTVDLGIGRRLLYEITKFYRVYPIVHAVRAQLSWTHYRSLTEIESEEARTFYENQTILHSWSSRELKKQIKARLYEKTPKKEIQTVFSLPKCGPPTIGSLGHRPRKGAFLFGEKITTLGIS